MSEQPDWASGNAMNGTLNRGSGAAAGSGGLGGISPLLGTRAAQAAVDALARQVTNLSDSLSRVAASLNRTAQSHGGGVGNPSTQGGGRPNGGGSTPTGPGSPWYRTYLNAATGQPPPQTPQNQTGGRGNGGWGVVGVTAMAGAGLGRMDTMVSTNTTAQLLSRNSDMRWGNVRSQFARNNYTATDSIDAAKGAANLQRLGYRVGTSQWSSANQYVKNFGAIDPTATAGQVSGAMAGMASASTYNYLAGRGIRTIGRGGVMNPTQLASQMINTIGGSGKWTKGQAEYFMGDRGQGKIALDSMLRSGAINQDQYETLTASMKAQTTFMAHGGTQEQFQSALAKHDTKTLSKYGVKETDTNRIKNFEAKKRNVEDNMAEGFSKGLDHATDALSAFTQALEKITGGRYGIGAALGYGQGLTGTMAAGAGGALTGLLGNRMSRAVLGGALNRAAGSRVGSAALGAAGRGLGLIGGGGALAAGGAVAGGGLLIGSAFVHAARDKDERAARDAAYAAHGTKQHWYDNSFLASANNVLTFGLSDKVNSKFHSGSGDAGWATGGADKPDTLGNQNKAGKNAARTVKLQRPASGPITSKFGARKSPGGIGSTNHKGLDFGAPNGSSIVAANSGKVVSAGMTSGGYGNQTIIDHGGGMQTMYAHQSAIRVRPGQTVRRGQSIGAVGSTGHSTGPHLHFEVHLNGRPVDPAPYLGAGGMVGSGNSDPMAESKADAASGDKSPGASQDASGLLRGSATGQSEADIVAAALGGSMGLAPVANKGAGNESTGASADTGGTSSAAPGGPAPKGSVASWIKSALGVLKLDYKKYASPLNTIIQHESGGNPRAINNWDSNAKAGHPSKGLMQTIDSTFSAHALAGHKDIWNPVDNIIAATRYALSRYGSMDNVPGIKSLMNGGGYKGYAVGSTNIDVDQIAKVHKGEMVLDANTAETFRQALQKNTPTKSLFGGGGGGQITLQFNPGSIVLQASGPMNDSQATDFANSFVRMLANHEELKTIAAGN